MHNKRSLLLAVAACIVLTAPTLQSAAGEPSPRIAVLADANLRDSPLVDLLTVELSNRRSLDLLDRAELARIGKELKLSEVLSTSAAGQRLKLGELLGADAMVFLSLATGAQHEFVKVCICDSGHGARLRVEHLPYRAENAEAAARQIAQMLDATLKEFRGGIRHVIGVAPFVCRNLGHHDDHLQQSYALLLQNSLSRFPGVAAIETEEALAISRELTLAGGGVTRVVPQVIDAAFEVTRPESGAPATVRFQVTIRNTGDRKTESLSATMPLADSLSFITEHLPKQILPHQGQDETASLSREEQTRWLISRADVFSDLGAWTEAVGIREAALLLDANQPIQLLQAIFEYFKIFDVPGMNHQTLYQFRRSGGQEPLIDDAKRLQPTFRRIAAYGRALQHFEYLVRNRHIDRGLALGLASRMTTTQLAIDVMLEALAEPLRRRLAEEIVTAESAENRMLTDVFPLIPTLSKELASVPSKFRYSNHHLMADATFNGHLGDVVIDAAANRRDRDYYTAGDLDQLRYMMEDVVGRHGFMVTQLRFRLFQRYREHARERPHPEAVTCEQWIEFLMKLKDSPYPVSQAHGHRGLLWTLKYDTEARRSAKIAAAKEAFAWARRTDDGSGNSILAPTRRFIERQASTEAKRLGVELSKTGPPVRPVPLALDPRARRNIPPPDPSLSRLRFEPIRLSVLGRDGRPYPSGLPKLNVEKSLPCGKDLTVFWSPRGRVLFMSSPDTVREVCNNPQLSIGSVAWDGRHVWLAAQSKGLYVLDTTGRAVARIGAEQGLPPCDVALMVHPVSEGRVIAAGSFGEHRRGWLAQVERTDATEQPKVNVFHRATRTFIEEDRSQLPQGVDVVFRPLSLHQCDATDDGKRMLYVTRITRGRRDLRLLPLAVDLDTLAVEVGPPVMSRGLSVTITTWVARTWSRKHIACFELHASNWAQHLNAETNNDQQLPLCTGHQHETRFLFHNGWFYRLDLGLRVNAVTSKHEFLFDGPLPEEQKMYYHGVTVHHGLVGWNSDGTMVRISVDETQPEIHGSQRSN